MVSEEEVELSVFMLTPERRLKDAQSGEQD